MTHVIYKHDSRPYRCNKLIGLYEYDYKFPERAAHWPKEFQHPLGCRIEYESEAVLLADEIEFRMAMQAGGLK